MFAKFAFILKVLFRLHKKKASVSPGMIAWRRFKKIPTAMVGLVYIIFAAALALFAYMLIPDKTPHANHHQLELALHRPGTRMHILHIKRNQIIEQPSFFKSLIYGQPSQYNTIPVISWWFDNEKLYYEIYPGEPGYSGVEAYVNIADVLYALDTTHDVEVTRGDSLLFTDIKGTSHRECMIGMQERAEESITITRFVLGTDRFGRDMLSLLVIGARVSLSVGFIAVCISLIIGIGLGSFAGFFRGRTDRIILWLINVVWSIPTLLLAIAITFALGKGFWQVFVAVGLTMWVEVARLVRGQVISVRENEYVEAAKALGLSSYRIIYRHILPVTMGPVIIISAANFASAILIEAGLSFLGIGVQPPMPSWGSMIREHYGYIILDKAYLALLPGVAIMLMVLAFMLIGNGLRDALDRSAKD